MKKIPSLLLFLLFSSNAYAGSVIKPYSIGIGTYATVIAYDDPFIPDDELSGVSISFAYAFYDQFSLRATYFSLEHDDFSDLDSRGFDFLAHLGTGLATQGFKAYIGGGLFTDKWERGAFSETFDGLQLNGGIGYNWDSVALDLMLGIRDASDYEDFKNQGLFSQLESAAVSGTLQLSYRF